MLVIPESFRPDTIYQINIQETKKLQIAQDIKKTAGEGQDEFRFNLGYLCEILDAALNEQIEKSKGPNLGIDLQLIQEISQNHKVVDVKFSQA